MATKSKKQAVVATATIAPTHMPEVAPAPSFYPALSLESLAGLGCANLAAVTKANLALSQGMQAIGQEMLRCAQSVFEGAGQAATALLAAETFDAVVKLNTDLATAGLQVMLARSATFSEMGASLSGGAFAPLGSQVEAAVLRFAKPNAA